MCVKSYQHFSVCDHVCSVLTTCPTYRKEQDSANGFFGSLFRRSVKTTKNCGKVVPHYARSEAYCQACSVKKHHLRAKEVGQGALRVHRQGVEESFRDEGKKAAKASLQKSRHLWRQKEFEVIDVQSSVWLYDLYDHPESLARKEAYARPAAPAPPVSSRPRKEGQPWVAETSFRGRTRDGLYGKTRTVERTPAYGNSQPLVRPVQPVPTYQYSGRFAYNSPSLPPATGLPPRLQRNNQSHVPPSTQKKYPELKHKTGRVYNSTKSRNQPAVPAYQVCLEALSTRATLEEFQQARASANSKPVSPALMIGMDHWTINPPSRWENKKAPISNWVDKPHIFSDESSDVSFVCQTARVISEQPWVGARRDNRK